MDIHNYIIGGTLAKDVKAAIDRYEQFTDIDQYMQHSGKTWFYEYTIQGFIYSRLREYDHGYKDSFTSLIFLEEPYSADSSENRADIMFAPTTDIDRKNSSAIELKTDFQYNSILTDMLVLVHYLQEKKIKTGYGIFFAESDKIVNDWTTQLRNEHELKAYFQNKTLWAVCMVGNPH